LEVVRLGCDERLHAKDLIFDPVGKAKSVVLTEEGRRRCEALFFELFREAAWLAPTERGYRND